MKIFIKKLINNPVINFIDKLYPWLWYTFLLLLLFTDYLNQESVPYLIAILIFMAFAPIVHLRNPKELFNNNILFMAFITYLILPVTISIWLSYFISFVSNVTILMLLILIFIVSVSLFFFMYNSSVKNTTEKLFLENARISFDILRFIFVVVLSVSIIYANITNDFSSFIELFNTVNERSTEENRKHFILLFQSVSLPFTVSSIVLKIVSDYLLLRRNRK